MDFNWATDAGLVDVAPVADPELERSVVAGTTFAASQLPRKYR